MRYYGDKVELSLGRLSLIFLAGLLLSGFFSMLEAAIISQDRHRLNHLADKGVGAAVVMRGLLANIDELLAAILLCNNLANVVCATTAAVFVAKLTGGGDNAVFVSTLAVTFLILVFGEITPKVMGVRHAPRIALACARMVRALLVVLRPVIFVANFFAGGLLWLFGANRGGGAGGAMNIAELRSAVRAAGAGGGEHYRMLDTLLAFSEMPLEKIMTPRRDIRGVDLDSGDDAINRAVAAFPHSKLPLYRGGIDRVAGTADTVEALRAMKDAPMTAAKLRAMMRPPHFVPAADTVLRQMEKLRRAEINAAFVVDGAGRVVGMVTLTNFASAIIGTSAMPANIAPDARGGFSVPAAISLLQLSQLLPDADWPETSATNLNGLILEYLDALPESPLCLRLGGLCIEITEVGDRAISRARVFADAAPDRSRYNSPEL